MIVTQISDYRYPSTMVLKAHCMGTTEMGAPERSRFPRNYGVKCTVTCCTALRTGTGIPRLHTIENGFRTVSEAIPMLRPTALSAPWAVAGTQA